MRIRTLGYLKQRLMYYEKIANLKWDIWFYFTTVQIILNVAVLACIALGVGIYIFFNRDIYIDPFSDIKNFYTITNIGFIVILAGLNIHFIFKGAGKEHHEKRLKVIMGFTIMSMLAAILLFVLIVQYINGNIELLHMQNPHIFDNVKIALLENTATTAYKIPFYVSSAVLLFIYISILYHNCIWLYRLHKQGKMEDKMDIVFDEEENVKM